MRLMLILAFGLLFAPLPALGQDVPIPEESNETLVYLLNNVRILGERGNPPELLGYIVRVFAVGNEGECGGTPQSCPTVYGYIAISMLGEDPPMALYRLPDSYGWTLDSWVDVPKDYPLQGGFIVLHMTRQVVAEDSSKGWFVPEHDEIKINLTSATMRKL